MCPPKRNQHTFEVSKHLPAQELSTLLKVSSALTTSLDLSVVLQVAIDSAVAVMGLDTGAIYLLEGDALYLGATTPPLSSELQWLRLQPEMLQNHPHLQDALTRRQPVYITDTQTADLSPAEAAVRNARHLRTILYIPLLLEEKAIGALIVGTTGYVRGFNEHEIDLCRILAHQITLAVANARLFKSVQQTYVELTHAYDATLLGWSLALEMRDQETQGHTQRVTQLSETLARKMSLTEPLLSHIRRGALLHDIGKMGIPDVILKKPGPLTEDEWVIMRKHPEFAYRFLLHIDYLAPVLEIPYCHHEKWDGSGYPRGLQGEAIPLAARIFAVVDVFDALTTDRPYRKAWKKEAALTYVREQAGKHFDPCVVDSFFKEMAASL